MIPSITVKFKCEREDQMNSSNNCMGKGSIIQFIKDASLEWAGHVWRTDNSTIKTVHVNNLNKKNHAVDPNNDRWM